MFILQDLSLFCRRLALFLCDPPKIHQQGTSCLYSEFYTYSFKCIQ